jgi:hypothetical protein
VTELAARDKKFVEDLAKVDDLPFDYVMGTLERDRSFESDRIVSLSLSSYDAATLDLRGLDALTKVSVSSDELETITLGALPKLVSLKVETEALGALDLSGCTALTSLDLARCGLEKLPALPPRLTALKVADNPLGAFVLTWPTLESLDVTRCELSALDVSKLPGLRRLDCAFNTIKKLDLGKLDRLEVLWCQGNGAELRLPPKAPLTKVAVGKNPLRAFDASRYPKLTMLFVDDGALSSLTLDNPALEHLDCAKNALSQLDVASARALRILTANENPIRSLDLRALPKLRELAIDTTVTVECTDLQKHVLPDLRARFGLPKPTKTIAKMDLYQLHAFVDAYNWDDGPKALFQVVRHAECTLATAMLMYWQSQPAEFSSFAKPKDAPQSERKWVELLREIEAGVAKKKFARGPLSFDVHDVGGVDLSDDDAAIPAHMRVVVKGEAKKRSAH